MWMFRLSSKPAIGRSINLSHQILLRFFSQIDMLLLKNPSALKEIWYSLVTLLSEKQTLPGRDIKRPLHI